jgi:hypothetical protein
MTPCCSLMWSSTTVVPSIVLFALWLRCCHINDNITTGGVGEKTRKMNGKNKLRIYLGTTRKNEENEWEKQIENLPGYDSFPSKRLAFQNDIPLFSRGPDPPNKTLMFCSISVLMFYSISGYQYNCTNVRVKCMCTHIHQGEPRKRLPHPSWSVTISSC